MCDLFTSSFSICSIELNFSQPFLLSWCIIFFLGRTTLLVVSGQRFDLKNVPEYFTGDTPMLLGNTNFIETSVRLLKAVVSRCLLQCRICVLMPLTIIDSFPLTGTFFLQGRQSARYFYPSQSPLAVA